MENVDVIVVGAGPAGSAAAYYLAKAGQQVLLIERGKTPGEKNVSGGILYGRALHRLIPNFWEDAPVERFIISHNLNVLSGDSAIRLGFSKKEFAKPPFNGISVIRYKFDQWFAKQAEEAGALLATGIRVDELIWNNKRIVGIKAGDDEIGANIVIAADGINSLLAAQANLRTPHRPELLGLGIKEAISLPRDIIEERFHLSGREGAAMMFLGGSKGFPGGGFLFTNLETLSMGVIEKLIREGKVL